MPLYETQATSNCRTLPAVELEHGMAVSESFGEKFVLMHISGADARKFTWFKTDVNFSSQQIDFTLLSFFIANSARTKLLLT